MVNKNFAKFFFLFYLAIFICAMANVYAAPTITIISPNGGEVLNGTATIQWTASDSENSQIFNSSLWYSGNPGNKNNFIADINLLNSCSFVIGSGWVKNNNYISGIRKGALDNYEITGHSALFLKDNNFYLINPRLLTGGLSNANEAYQWNGSAWIPNYDINKGIPTPTATGDFPDVESYTVFSISGHYYFLRTYRSGVTRFLQGFDWNGSEWVTNEDINKTDFYSTGANQLLTAVFEYNGLSHLIVSIHPSIFQSYDWNGSGWNRNDFWIKDMNRFALNNPAVDIFKIGNSLNAFVYSKNSGFANSLTFSAGSWIPNYDLNKNIPATTYPQRITANYNNNLILIQSGERQGAGNIEDFNSYLYNANLLDTTTPASCSYSWNTNSVMNGYYYLDINSTATGTSLVSSGQFQILNYSSADLNVVCVENCTVQGFDGNAIVLNPINEAEQIKFYAQNSESDKSFFIKINNSLNDGKRYFAYSSTPNNSDANYSFDKTLTHGSDSIFIDAIQKIWNGSKFVYSMTEPNLTGGHKKYYLLKYQAPIKQWSSIANSVEWDKRLNPEAKDINNLIKDIYSTSSYAFMQNELIEKIPAITSVPTKNLIFLFTGKAATGTNTIFAGQVANKNDTAANSATINSTERTFDFQSSAGGYLSQKTPATVSTLEIYDYAIVPAGMFLKNIKITDSQNGELPALIVSGKSWQFLREGQKYKVNSSIYDQDGELKTVEVFVYLETVNDANLVSYSVFDYARATEAGQTHSLSLEMPGIIDFTAGNKKMLVKIRATANGYSEISSEWLEFVQFPYYAGDFKITSDIENKIVAQSPKITVAIRDILPDTLRGVTVSFFADSNTPEHSDFNKTFYPGTDFICNGLECDFSKTISEWVFPYSGTWNFTANALLTTQNADWNSLITSTTKTFIVSVRELDTLRILEGLDRQSSGLGARETIYKNSEEAIFTLQIKDKNPSVNFKDILDVHFNLWHCAATTGTDCNQINSYAYDSFIYDETTGYNYYFIKRTFVEADGSLLYDGNHYRLSASINDKTGAHGETVTALLTSKCISYPSVFVSNTFGMNLFGGGCDIPQDLIVTDANISREMRITIDNSLVLTPPVIHQVYCLKNDKAGLFINPLEQEKLCAVVYSFNKQPIDSFNFIVSNNNSDFAKTGGSIQYLHSSIPYSLILFNDLSTSRQLLSLHESRPAVNLFDIIMQGFDSIGVLEYSTDWSEEIKVYLRDCVGKVISAPHCYFLDKNAYNFISKNYDSDLNLDTTLDSGLMDGVLFVKLKGIKPVNIQDYVSEHKDLNAIKAKDFLEYANYKKYPVTIGNTQMQYFGNGNVQFFSENIISPLVINVALSEKQLKSFDQNAPGQSSIPIPLTVNFITDLIYNNGINAQRVIVPLTIFSEFNRPSSLDKIFSNPFGFILENFLYFAAALIIIVAVSVAWYNFTQKGGGTTVINRISKR